MSSVKRTEAGTWEVRYRDDKGRARRKRFKRKVDAENWSDNTSTDIRRGEWLDPRHSRDTFDRWADRWWATTVKLRPTTRRGYHGVLERHVRPYFEGRRVVEIDYMHVEDFIATKLADGLSAKYVRECVSVLSLIMRSAVRGNVRRDNPAAGHNVPTRRRKIRQGDVLTMEQVHQLVEHVSEPYRPAVWTLVLTGIRPAELCGLRVRSVDFQRRRLHVTQTLLPVHKYADELYQGRVLGPPKTLAGDRTIPLPAWLCEDLAKMLAARKQGRGTDIEADEYLFQTRYGNPINRDKLREKVIRPALAAAGLPTNIRTYDLRHTHASELIDMGANVLEVAQRMGHSDPAVTLREYGHLFEGAQERLTEQLDERRATAAKAMIGKVIALPNA